MSMIKLSTKLYNVPTPQFTSFFSFPFKKKIRKYNKKALLRWGGEMKSECRFTAEKTLGT